MEKIIKWIEELKIEHPPLTEMIEKIQGNLSVNGFNDRAFHSQLENEIERVKKDSIEKKKRKNESSES